MTFSKVVETASLKMISAQVVGERSANVTNNKFFRLTALVQTIILYQEPITRSLHLPYKPLESTLSDEKLLIEIVFAENLPRPNA